ncbi:DUF4138 domain-containing protein [Mucilaginibacter corticis]|uniref:DUF4138 domain-containing protein n=1 Tax=Mucilaginibacter corticis TaxID=2597670 RepID=UPI001FECF343|nr:DUF4138 domain-containing protein [Mucilaginibacter corticis]
MNYILAILLSLFTYCVQGQNNLPTVYLPANLTVHFISPEPIQYVDISSRHIVGDLPLKNVLRIKIKDSVKTEDDAVVTITGEKFIAQYHVIIGGSDVPTEINIEPKDTRPLDLENIGLSTNQLKALCLEIAAKKPPKPKEKTKAFGINAKLNHLYTFGDYLFVDLSFQNNTNLRYDIDELRYKIDDKKSHQSIQCSIIGDQTGIYPVHGTGIQQILPQHHRIQKIELSRK